MSHTARGLASFFTRSIRDSAPTAFSLTSSPTVSGDRSNTAQLCPFLISRRTMLAPIRPRPIIPNCIYSPFEDWIYFTVRPVLQRPATIPSRQLLRYSRQILTYPPPAHWPPPRPPSERLFHQFHRPLPTRSAD